MGDVEEVALEIASSFVGVLEPLGRLSTSQAELEAVLAQLGWPVAPGTDLSGVQAAIDIGGDLDRLRDALGTLELDDVGSVVAAIAAIATAADHVRGLVAGPSGMSGFPPPFNSDAFWDTFPLDVLELLTVRALERNRPALAALLGFVGFIDDGPVAAAPPRQAYRRQAIDIDAVASFLGDPLG